MVIIRYQRVGWSIIDLLGRPLPQQEVVGTGTLQEQVVDICRKAAGIFWVELESAAVNQTLSSLGQP